jgi:nitroreductase
VPDFAEVADGLRMPLVDAMETQRAIRRLRPDPVDDETIMRCLDLAAKAPSGSNFQGWEWVVVRDPDVKHQLARLNRQAWSVLRRVYARATTTDDERRTIDAVQWQADHFEEVPVVVVACLRGVRPPFPPIATTSYYGSIYPAIQNLLLAARSLGLGATLTTLPVWSAILARRTLGLPWKVSPIAVIPLGWPKGGYGPTTRRDVAETVHLDRFGNRAFLAPLPTPA